MPLFTVTNGSRVLTVRAACRTCARRVAVEYIALSVPTSEWRDPEVTKIALSGTDTGKVSEVVLDSDNGYAVGGLTSGAGEYRVGEAASDYLVSGVDIVSPKT